MMFVTEQSSTSDEEQEAGGIGSHLVFNEPKVEKTRGMKGLGFTYSDVVPIKYHHYLKEYEFEKNLPAKKEYVSK